MKSLNLWQSLLLTSAIAAVFAPIAPSSANAHTNNVKLLAQSLGGIVREIPLSEIPSPAITAAKTVTDAQFTKARNEIQRDGSSRYILRGKNQEGLVVEVQVSAIGTITQVDEQIDPSGVPESALKVFKKWAPNSQLISTWKSTRLGETLYQFVIEDHWLEISPQGDKVIIYRQKVKYQ